MKLDRPRKLEREHLEARARDLIERAGGPIVRIQRAHFSFGEQYRAEILPDRGPVYISTLRILQRRGFARCVQVQHVPEHRETWIVSIP